jgi:hypothetical protein
MYSDQGLELNGARNRDVLAFARWFRPLAEIRTRGAMVVAVANVRVRHCSFETTTVEGK